jgi:hypothetical protein
MASSYYDSSDKVVYTGNVAEAADLNTINTAVDTAFQLVESAITGSESDASYYSAVAEEWASNPEDDDITTSPGDYSALHYSAKASASASAASGSASTASSAATAAGNAQTAAEAAQSAAETAETNAETAETGAQTAQTAAETAQTAAETAQTAAETAETNAETAETGALAAQSAAETAQTACEARVPYPIDTLNDEGSIGVADSPHSLVTTSYDTFLMTITGDITLVFSGLTVGRTISLVITNGGASTITWPTEVQWPEGTAPTLTSSGTDRVVFQKISATVIHGAASGLNYS